MSHPTIGQSIVSMSSRPLQATALKFKKQNQWLSKNWQEYYNDIEQLGLGLLEVGVKAKDRVAIFSNTRYEWALADMAIMGIGAATVPIYQNNTPEDVEYILNNSESRVIFCESATLKTFEKIKDRCPSIEKIYVFDNIFQGEAESLSSLLHLGTEALLSQPNTFKDLCQSLTPDDMATLLYTSGTTGTPKGVVLTHKQVYSEISEAFPFCGVTPADVSLSFLPYAHILGRIELWGHMYVGFTLAFAESIEKVRSNLKEIQPTILVSVPRIFEKVYATIMAQIQTQSVKKVVFEMALAVGKEVGFHKISGQSLPLTLLAKYEVAKKTVLNKITEAMGGRLRFAISGGAPLSPEIAEFFHSAGVLVLEGYGLTETTAAVCVNTPFNYRMGSVGRPIGEVQIKIAEDGEILVKSAKVMKEYYKNPEATAEAFTDGWFHTGDMGEILQGGDLKITDRKKNLLKTAAGKYVAPQKLESFLKTSPWISNIYLHGDQKKYVVALLTLDQEQVTNAAKNKGVTFKSWKDLLDSSFVKDTLKNLIADTNSHLASYESIKKYAVLPQDFSVETGELTPSLKVKRKVVEQKYSEVIEDMYS